MASLSAQELVKTLLKTNIYVALYEDRLTLQQQTILSIPGVIQELCHKLGLPPSDNLDQFRKDYNWKYYTKFCPMYLSDYQCFNKAAEYGELEIVKYYVENNLVRDINDAIDAAGKGNHLEIINYLTSKNPDKIYIAVSGAVTGDNLELFDFLLSRYEDVGEIDDWIKYAGDAGSVSIASRLEQLYGEQENMVPIVSMNAKLAIHARDLDKLKSLPLENSYYLEEIVLLAAEKGYTEMIEYLLSLSPRGYSQQYIVGKVIQGAIEGGHFDLYDKYQRPGNDIFIRYGLSSLVEDNRRDLIEILFTKVDYRVFMDTGLNISVLDNNRDLIQYFLNLGANNYSEAIAFAIDREDTHDLIPFFEELQQKSQDRVVLELPSKKQTATVVIPWNSNYDEDEIDWDPQNYEDQFPEDEDEDEE